MTRRDAWYYEIALAAIPVAIKSIFRGPNELFSLMHMFGSFEMFVFSLVLMMTTLSDLIGNAPLSAAGNKMRGNAHRMIMGSIGIVLLLGFASSNPGSSGLPTMGIIVALSSLVVCTNTRSVYLWSH